MRLNVAWKGDRRWISSSLTLVNDMAVNNGLYSLQQETIV